MEIQTETQPAPPTEQKHIVESAGPVVVLEPDVQTAAERIQRQLPGLDWQWCVVLGRAEVAHRGKAVDDGAGERLEYLQHRRRTMTARRPA